MRRNKIEVFKKLVNEDKLSHAYLFFGESKNEKIDFAESLANHLENNVFEKPKKLLEEALIISADSIGIDKIREFSNFLYQKPVFSEKRIVVVNNSEVLSTEAQNAALKIVEESPSQSLIIFISKNEDSLIPALVSRLQKIYFPSKIFKENLGGQAKHKWNLPLLKKEVGDIVENNKIDDFFESLIIQYKKDPIKNNSQLKEILKRLTLFKKYNINKKLQIRCLF